MSQGQPVLKGLSGVLIIELDPTADNYPEIPPASLATEDASELVNSIAADLLKAIPELNKFGVIIPAGLYNQFEILQMGFPLQNILQEIYIKSQNADKFTPTVIALGSEPDGFPIAEISPCRDGGYGAILSVPFSLVGLKDDITELDKVIDTTLLEKGHLSDNTSKLVTEKFGLSPVNTSYVSLANLCAIFKTQLESIECGALWSLIEDVFFTPQNPIVVRSEVNNIFVAQEGKVFTQFLTYNQWKDFSNIDDSDAVIEEYIQWTAMYRQYTIGLDAHGIKVCQTSINKKLQETSDEEAMSIIKKSAQISKHFYTEEQIVGDDLSLGKNLLITEQIHDHVGTVAFTVTITDSEKTVISLTNYYPLSFEGIDDISDLLSELAEKSSLQMSQIQDLTL